MTSANNGGAGAFQEVGTMGHVHNDSCKHALRRSLLSPSCVMSPSNLPAPPYCEFC